MGAQDITLIANIRIIPARRQPHRRRGTKTLSRRPPFIRPQGPQRGPVGQESSVWKGSGSPFEAWIARLASLLQYLQVSCPSGAEFSACRCRRQSGRCSSMIDVKRLLIPAQVRPLSHRWGMAPILSPHYGLDPRDRHTLHAFGSSTSLRAPQAGQSSDLNGQSPRSSSAQGSARSFVSSATCGNAGREP